MRPLILSLSAFGPYAEQTTIDFTVLENRNLFLIHGPTGSGKSSILDAMCFALYGETSGGEKDVKGIRSDYALPQEPTETTFDFLLGEKHYQVFRSPEQDRPKKRGDGTTRQLAQATLYRIDGETRTVISDRWSNVTDEVGRIMGFDVLQFRQVVVLPQGQFRKFLLSGSSDRQKILETLFQTSLYRDIEDALKEEAKGLKTAYEEAQRRKLLLLEQENAADQDDLNLQIQALEKAVAERNSSIENLRTHDQKAQALLFEAKETRTKFLERESARKSLNELTQRQPEMENVNQRLDRARKALSLKDSLKNRDTRMTERADVEKKQGEIAKQIGVASNEHDAAVASFEVEKSYAAENAEKQAHLDVLKGLVDKIAGYAEARKSHEAAIKKTSSLASQANRIRETRLDLSTKIEQQSAQLVEKKDGAARVEILTQKVETLGKRVAKQNELRELTARKNTGADVLDKRKDLLKNMETLRDKARTIHEQTLDHFHAGQAAILARTLVQGSPCPVCGSTDHPAPHPTDQGIPDERTLKKTKADLDLKEKETKDMIEDVRALTEERLGLISRVSFLGDELGELADQDPNVTVAELTAARKDLKTAMANQKDVASLALEIETLKGEEAKKTAELTAAEKSLAESEQACGALKAVAELKLSEIPEPYRDVEAVNSRIIQTEKALAERKLALERAELLRNKAVTRLERLKESLIAAEQSVTQCRDQAERANLELENRLAQEGFNDRADVIRAMKDADYITELSEQIKNYDDRLNAAADRFNRADLACRDLVPSDVDGLEKTLAGIKDSLEQTAAEKSRFETQSTRKKATLADLEQCRKRHEDIEKEYAVTGAMAEAASGKNPAGMTFQRYVLSALLDDVLFSAGHHLKAMSRNRFDLLRARERSDMRSAGGLDLLVSDDHTGTTRPVATLSGGESFLASLSLALGLADVVQAYAGGIKLDTMFVDEGFGSLDPESLDLAFRTFADLQVRGRLVGIISHVPELKERMDTRLEVVPGKRGSVARFVL
jgi:exonuclease SbcC